MNDIKHDLELDKILHIISGYASSDVVAREIENTVPITDTETAEKLLTRTGDAVKILASRRPDLSFCDINGYISKATVGAVLSPAELLRIRTVIACLRSLKSCVENTDGCDSLKDITTYARVCDDLQSAIDDTVENDSEIKDGASKKLYELRRAIVRANTRLKEKLDEFTHKSETNKYLMDNIVTVRSGRYVLPVRNDCRSHIKGLVHDVSSTGATVFIEPFSVVEANNEIITLKNEEQNEIERILAELSRKTVENASDLKISQEVLTECGVIFAKAEYSKHIDGYPPKLNGDGRIKLNGARHPLIPMSDIVPVDISLDDKRVLVISGPNTGGKTVALKTVGLFALMCSCGIFIPANEHSCMSIFNDIYCDIGDSQSIMQSLSTFSAHIANLKNITENMNVNSLVLLDEVGDGTDPDEGAALAIAVIKKILLAGSVAVVTTHFNAVKEFALTCDGISNACMQFDNVLLKPTYKLLQGVTGSSYALEIAEKLGLSKDIIDDAKSVLSREKIAFDNIMRKAEIMRNETMQAKEQCEQLRKEAQRNADETLKLRIEYENKLNDINENARIIIKRRADEYAERADSIIEQIKQNIRSGEEKALFEARKAAKKIYDGVPVDERRPGISRIPVSKNQLTVGTEVYVSGLDKNGIIAGTPRGSKALVAIGSVKTEVPISSLSLISTEQIKKTTSAPRTEREPETREIMLLGKTVDEATAEIDLVISDIAPRSVLRIVHGKGTGALGKGIQNYLKRNRRVKSFRYGRYGEGDTGVTIVEIK